MEARAERADIKRRIYEKFILKDSSIGCMIYEIYKTE